MSEKRKGARGPAPVVISSKLSKWIRESNSVAWPNSYKVGGGRPAWNGKK